MDRFRRPILVDLAGLTLVLGLWLAVLAAPIQASQMRFGLLGAAYCGTALPDGGPQLDTDCHACCLPALILPAPAMAGPALRLAHGLAQPAKTAQALAQMPKGQGPIRAPPLRAA